MTTKQNEVIVARNARAFRKLAELVPEVSKIEIWQLAPGKPVQCRMSKIDFESAIDPSPSDILILGSGASLTEAIEAALAQWEGN